MGDLLAGSAELAVDLLQQGAHHVLSVEEVSGLLVRLDVVLDLLLQVSVQLLVLQDR